MSSREVYHLYKIVRPARYVILLCDKDGLVIEHRGEDSEAAQFRRWGTWLGGVWAEGAEGTNGIGTCLADGRPVTVHRSQHFRARHINLSCSGAPIFDGNGELLGVLDVSSIDPELSEHAHALTGPLTIAAARAAGRHTDRALGPLGPRHRRHTGGDGSWRTCRCGARRLRPPRDDHHAVAAGHDFDGD